MVQDYQYLNEWTIKNNYPLSLILDIVESIGTKKVFTKIDLRWGYNNVQIKEEDEQKVMFCHKLSCTVKPQIRAICTYVGCTKVTTNN